MDIIITKDFSIAHDGIHLTKYSEGEKKTLPEKHALRLIDLGAAKEQKALNPVKEIKQETPKKRLGRKEKAD